MYTIFHENFFGYCADKFCHPRSVAYSAKQILQNKQQISGGRACLHCYHLNFYDRGYTWIFTMVNVRFTVSTPMVGYRYG